MFAVLLSWENEAHTNFKFYLSICVSKPRNPNLAETLTMANNHYDHGHDLTRCTQIDGEIDELTKKFTAIEKWKMISS